MMHRLLDFNHDETHDVANRVAMQIHRSVDEHFPNVANPSPRFSKTLFGGEDTALNQVRPTEDKPQDDQANIATKPRVQKLDAPTPQKPKAEPTPEPPRTDVRDLEPATEFGPGEFSDIKTLSNLRPSTSGLLKRVVFLVLVIAGLSAGIAYFVHRFLVS